MLSVFLGYGKKFKKKKAYRRVLELYAKLNYELRNYLSV